MKEETKSKRDICDQDVSELRKNTMEILKGLFLMFQYTRLLIKRNS